MFSKLIVSHSVTVSGFIDKEKFLGILFMINQASLVIQIQYSDLKDCWLLLIFICTYLSVFPDVETLQDDVEDERKEEDD